LAGYARDSGDTVRAAAYARRLEALAPQAAGGAKVQ
jgi:hypothetical protein